MRVTVGITGASGAVYALRLLQVLAEKKECEVHCVVSEQGANVMKHETGADVADLVGYVACMHDVRDMAAPIASGSFPMDSMVILPCSMKTLASVANGISDNLLLRAADVSLKEGRPLVLGVRETPLSSIHLKNMLELSRMGVKIVPLSPGFYHMPKTLESLVDMMVGRICDTLKIPSDLFERWKTGGQG